LAAHRPGRHRRRRLRSRGALALRDDGRARRRGARRADRAPLGALRMPRAIHRRLLPRLMAPVARAFRDTSEALASRCELARLEWKVERARLMQLAIGLGILALGGLLALAFVSLAIIVTWWDTEHRVLVAWLVCAGHALIALVGLFMLRYAQMRKDRRFAGLRAELAADREWLAQRLHQEGRHHG